MTPTARRLRDDRRGNVAMIVGLSLFPLIGAVGFGLDFARAVNADERLQKATDSGVLAAINAMPRLPDDADVKAVAKRYIDTNFGNAEYTFATFDIDREDNVVRVKTTGYSNNAFGALLGLSQTPIAADAVARGGQQDLEIALVLDNSGSMSAGGRMDALKAASKDLVDILMKDASLKDHIKFAIVPFNTAVNIGAASGSAAWMDTGGVSPIHGENFAAAAAERNRFNLFTTMGTPWAGCAEARPDGLDITDEPASVNLPKTLFVPMFAPDEPDTGSYPNNYLGDDGVAGRCPLADQGGDQAARQSRTCKYEGATPNTGVATSSPAYGHTNHGPNYGCKVSAVLPLSGDYDVVTAKLTAMQPLGGTNIVEGAVWGWRALSSTAPFTEGAPANVAKTRKILIVMTDGDNQFMVEDLPSANQNMSWYTPYGYSAKARIRPATRVAAEMSTALDERLAQVCANVKAQVNGAGRAQYDIYTITLAPKTQAGKLLMASCASDATMAFAPATAGELTPVFREIAASIRRIRLAE